VGGPRQWRGQRVHARHRREEEEEQQQGVQRRQVPQRRPRLLARAGWRGQRQRPGRGEQRAGPLRAPSRGQVQQVQRVQQQEHQQAAQGLRRVGLRVVQRVGRRPLQGQGQAPRELQAPRRHARVPHHRRQGQQPAPVVQLACPHAQPGERGRRLEVPGGPLAPPRGRVGLLEGQQGQGQPQVGKPGQARRVRPLVLRGQQERQGVLQRGDLGVHRRTRRSRAGPGEQQRWPAAQAPPVDQPCDCFLFFGGRKKTGGGFSKFVAAKISPHDMMR
jgi:hypothetical protein